MKYIFIFFVLTSSKVATILVTFKNHSVGINQLYYIQAGKQFATNVHTKVIWPYKPSIVQALPQLKFSAYWAVRFPSAPTQCFQLTVTALPLFT